MLRVGALLVALVLIAGNARETAKETRNYPGPLNPEAFDMTGVESAPDATQVKPGGKRLFEGFEPVAPVGSSSKAKPRAESPRKGGKSKGSPDAAALFLSDLMRLPRDVESQALEAKCALLPQDVPLFMDRARVPAALKLSGFVSDSASDVPVHAVVASALASQPELISVLACLAERGVLNATQTYDSGARLVYIAAARKHMRLLSLLLEQGAALDYVDRDTGFTVLHACVENGMLALDMAVSLLKVYGEDKKLTGSAASKAVYKTYAVKQAAAYPQWLGRIVTSMKKHLPDTLFAQVETAYSNLMEGSEVVAMNGTLLIAGDADGSYAALRQVNASNLFTLANTLSTLSLRLYTEAMLKTSARHAMQATMVVDRGDEEFGHLSQPSGVGVAVAVQLQRLLEARDRVGRTPLHIAAKLDNDVAITHMILAMTRIAGSVWQHADATFASRQVLGIPSLPSKDSFSQAVVTAYASGNDALGWTARRMACSRGGHKAAVLLYIAEHPTATSVAESQACREFAPVKFPQTVVDPAGPSPHGAQGWDDTQGLPSPHAKKAVQAAIDRAWSRLTPSAQLSISTEATQAADEKGHTILPDACDVPVIPAKGLTTAQFLERHALPNMPVLVRGSEDGARLVASWNKAAVLQRAGHLSFLAGDIPYGRSFGLAARGVVLTLEEYVHALETCGRQRSAEDKTDDVCDKIAAVTNATKGSSPLYIFDSPVKAKSGGDADSSKLATALVDDVPTSPAFMDVAVHDMLSPPPSAVVRLFDSLFGGESTCEAAAGLILYSFPQVDDADARASRPFVLPVPVPNAQVYLGGPGSGAPMHFHKDAWNALASGEKRWYLLPPHKALYSTQASAAWLLELKFGLENLSPPSLRLDRDLLECTQRPGDVLYVPYGWGHAVLNTAPGVTLGIAMEFSSPLVPLAR